MKTALQHYTSRTADKFVVRLPEGMRDRIAEVAKQHHRSMNSEIIARLEHSLLDLPSLPEYPSRQALNDQQIDALNQPERELLLRFREMSRRQQNALLAPPTALRSRSQVSHGHSPRGPEMKEPARVTWRALSLPQSECELTKASRIPAATAEPITPATFGPMACISRKFCGLDSSP